MSRDAATDGKPFSLTRREASALEELLLAGGRIVVRDVLGERLYDSAEEITLNAIEATISRLRRKLACSAASAHIETIRGVGYRLIDGDLS